MTTHVLTVTSAALAGREADYDEWYEAHHFKDMQGLPGVVAARRLEAAPGSPNPPPAQYLAEFDIEGEEPQAVIAEMLRRAGSGEWSLSDALDQTTVQIWLFERR